MSAVISFIITTALTIGIIVLIGGVGALSYYGEPNAYHTCAADRITITLAPPLPMVSVKAGSLRVLPG